MQARILTIIAALSIAATSPAATVVEVTSTVAVPSVKRMGMNLNFHYYYDRIILKNLAYRNAGFEGMIYQSIIRCAGGSANGCIDDNIHTQWQTGFWNGASYEFVLGSVKGRTGTVTSSTAPVPPAGTSYLFADSGPAPAAGDYFVVRKDFPGDAASGWNTGLTGGATISSERNDLHPATEGRQALRIDATTQGAQASLTGVFGSFANQTFLILEGPHRLTFKARGAGGTNRLRVSIMRSATNTTFLSETLTLGTQWETKTLDFAAAESGSPPGFIALRFEVMGAAVLLDDVSLEQTAGDPANTSPFRDAVIAALRDFKPGSLRGANLDLGDTLENAIASPFARQRTQYTAYGQTISTMQYGLHEMLQAAALVGAEPWWNLPTTFNDREMSALMEYLGGPPDSPWGARRAARGQVQPWTTVFRRIHIEFSNESWNPVFRGGTIERPDAYGRRADALFAIGRSSPWYEPAKFNFMLGGQSSAVANTRTMHLASTNHDSITLAPYMGSRIDDFASNEDLFGSLFAEASWWSSPAGFMRQTRDAIQATGRPVPLTVYELNLHTTQGSVSQEALNAFAPSAGAGVGVANHMLRMLRDLSVRDQVLFSLGGYRADWEGKTVLLWGVTRDIGVTNRKRPQYLAVKLANEALGGDLVQTVHTGDDPRWNQPLRNRIQLNDIPFIQSFAFVEGTRRSLLVFNLHRTSALDISVTGARAPSGTVTIRQLAARNITDNNEEATDVSITTSARSGFGPSSYLYLPPYSITLITSNEEGPPRRRKGDVNGNDSVTALDASLVLQAVVGARVLDETERCAADYNDSGSVSALDASMILQCGVRGVCSDGSC
jgi:alpha-L-arabinofuranosidase